MRLSIIFLAVLYILACCSCENDQGLAKAEGFIKTVQERYAPDPRVAFFNLTAESGQNGIVVKGMTISADAKKDLFQLFEKEGLKVVDSVETLPSPALDGYLFGVVNVSVCNIRSVPKHSAELATQALLGTPLRIWKKQGGFYLVQTPDDYFGWLDSGGFKAMQENVYGDYMNSLKAICTRDYVFAHAGPDENSGVVSDLLAGNILQTVENQGRFTKIKFPDGRTGFVNSNHLARMDEWLATRQPDAAQIIATAKEMMGRPYLWGGTSGKGMDCSGFTKTVFFLNGIQLPRDASQQVQVGEVVETDTTLKNLQQGDLLFFGRKADGAQKERVTHVAIYLGDGKIIHASNMVETGSLKRGDPDFLADRLSSFLKSKRIIGSVGKNGVVDLKDSLYYPASSVFPD